MMMIIQMMLMMMMTKPYDYDEDTNDGKDQLKDICTASGAALGASVPSSLFIYHLNVQFRIDIVTIWY